MRLSLFLVVLLLPIIWSCTAVEEGPVCLKCHAGLETASASHNGCVSCHGGDEAAGEKDPAHNGMFGPRNPSSPEFWDKSCGACHAYQLGRMQGNLMYTNTGMIRNIQQTWEGEDGSLYAARKAEVYAEDGNAIQLQPVAQLDNLSGELYRKFCALCHVGIESDEVYSASHPSGCAACHFPFNDITTYEGADPTVKGKWPYSDTHKMATLPENRVCFRCHNRSGRIALSYQGQYDGNNGLVPTVDGLPGPEMISGARNVTSIVADVHFEKGMDCIDCHTSRDVMGDGYAHRNMYEQTEIRCRDCHGSATERPKSEVITRENDEALRESKNYAWQAHPGTEMVLTGKGRKYSNVFAKGGKIFVAGKRSGVLHESKVITGTPEHTIAGHERMECYSCHSRTVVQCYGCHTGYDRRKMGRDFVKGKETPGAFTETEDYRMLYPFPLAFNQKGKISPVTPGCQTFVSVTGEDGKQEKVEEVTLYKGRRQLRFAPFYSHNTGKKAIGCRQCHGNPAFLGFGQHVVEEEGNILGTLICDKSDSKPLDGYLTMDYGRVRAYSAITREHSRPLSGAEVKRVLGVNLCLACHDDPKDPIYQKELDDRALADCLDRPAAD